MITVRALPPHVANALAGVGLSAVLAGGHANLAILGSIPPLIAINAGFALLVVGSAVVAFHFAHVVTCGYPCNNQAFRRALLRSFCACPAPVVSGGFATLGPSNVGAVLVEEARCAAGLARCEVDSTASLDPQPSKITQPQRRAFTQTADQRTVVRLGMHMSAHV